MRKKVTETCGSNISFAQSVPQDTPEYIVMILKVVSYIVEYNKL